MERKTMKFIVLPKKDTEQDGFPRNLHFLPQFFGTKSSRLTHSHPDLGFGEGAPFAILRPERGRKPTE
jgi:hypothetical protein